MNKVGQYKLFMSIGLALLVIILGYVFSVITHGKGLWILFSVIVLLAMIAVAVNFMSIKLLKGKLNNLPDPYKKVYMDAQEAVGLSSMSKLQKKEVNEMILEIFEHASLDQRDINDVIDHNLEAYVNQFINIAGGKPSFLYMFSYSSFLFVIYLIFIKLYKVIRPGFDLDNFKTETLDFGITATYALIAFIFFPWLMMIMKKASIERWNNKKRLLILLPFIIPFGLMALLILVRIPEVVDILDMAVPMFSSIYSFFIGVLAAVGFFILMKYAQRKQMKKSIE